MSDTMTDLERRLEIIEDRFAILDLLASHPPSADTGSTDYTLTVYKEDGEFDRGPTLDGASGKQDIASFIQRPEHHRAMRGGLAHVGGLPLIELNGGKATATSYLLIVHLDDMGPARDLPNHGVSTGYRIHRAVVNRWDLEKIEGKWMIARRTLLPVDGSDPHLGLLRKSLSEMYDLPFDPDDPTGETG